MIWLRLDDKTFQSKFAIFRNEEACYICLLFFISLQPMQAYVQSLILILTKQRFLHFAIHSFCGCLSG